MLRSRVGVNRPCISSAKQDQHERRHEYLLEIKWNWQTKDISREYNLQALSKNDRRWKKDPTKKEEWSYQSKEEKREAST